MKSQDIARLAGVSRSTVSRVINNYPNVPAETRQRVMKVIKQYNYVPNNPARILAGKGMNTLGLFIISIDEKHTTNRIYQNNFFAPFLDIVVDKANNCNFYALVHTVYTQKDYLKIQNAFLEKRIDGGIIVGTKDDTIDLVKATPDYPLVLIDYDPNKLPSPEDVPEVCNIALVNSRDEQGIELGLDYLMKLGHTQIGLIAGRHDTFSGRVRSEAFRKGIAARGLEFSSDYLVFGEFLKDVAYWEVKKLIRSKKPLPTACISADDDMAISAMEAFKEEGIGVPEQVSIIGFDDVPIAGQLKPGLTTIHVPIYEMGCQAVESLIEIVNHQPNRVQLHTFPVTLIERGTCSRVYNQ